MKSIETIIINEENLNMMSPKQTKQFNVKLLLNNPNLSQSQCIRFGNLFEKIAKNLVNFSGLKLIDIDYVNVSKNKRKQKNRQLDLIFEKNNNIYYLELKSNCFLDSEKYPSTDGKINSIADKLTELYPNKTIFYGALVPTYYRDSRMYISIKSEVYFMNEFFKILGIEITEKEYNSILHKLGSLINTDIEEEVDLVEEEN